MLKYEEGLWGKFVMGRKRVFVPSLGAWGLFTNVLHLTCSLSWLFGIHSWGRGHPFNAYFRYFVSFPFTFKFKKKNKEREKSFFMFFFFYNYSL